MMPASGLWQLTTLAIGLLGSSGGGPPPIGTPVADFELTDDRGDVHRLSDWQVSRLVTIVVLGAECPVAELYGTTLSVLAAEFQPRGVAFIGIAPNGRDTPSALAHFAAAHDIRFPLFQDIGGAVAGRLGATRTPEVVVLDDRRMIRYRGRIDDQYAVSSRRAEVRRHDLSDALEELLQGRPVGRPVTEAVGCPIDRSAPPPMLAEVTYCRDIAPILQRRCVECHRPGEIGPFSLMSYRRAAGWAEAIAEAVEQGRMPPWHADPRYGRFANDARLTDRERRLIVDWARGGAPEGEPADLPVPVAAPSSGRIPQPDLVISMPEPFTVPAQGVVDYQSFKVDPGFREDRWIRAAEIRPGNRKVVHHCNVFLKAPGSRNDLDAPGELGSYCLASTTPGAPPLVLPDGMAKRVPAGWRLVFVVHYSPCGTVQTDRTSIALRFADPRSVRKEVATNLLFDPDLRIPPHAADFRVVRSRRFDADVLLLAMFPHMHLRGKSFRYEAIYPDGRWEILLDVPRYDFGWQNRYQLAEPKRLPAGTTLRCTAHYDNSRDNPANPNPDATVRAGQQSWDEMFNGYYDIALADQDLTRPWSETLRKAAQNCQELALLFAGAACAMSLLLMRLHKHSRTVPVRPHRIERGVGDNALAGGCDR
jgi:peroxiredoxin